MEHVSWPFREAERVLRRFGENKEIVFATGYGPSGLPHIGTFSEALRTTFIVNALRKISPKTPTRILAFSDDMDGLRKVPENVPNREMLKEHLGKSLTSIPDPFGTHQSYGHHMNHLFCKFLDMFGFNYEFKSASECYSSGLYDAALLELLRSYEKVIGIMLPTLGEERRQTYSPFLPICSETQRVLQVPIVKVDTERGSVSYENESGNLVEAVVTGGHCKLQWKPDWGMRWSVFNVNYETHGKDLTPSAELSTRICKLLNSDPPLLFPYELFLDGEGKKISKSKGNGVSVEDWLSCAPYESLALYIFQNPKRAKRLCFEVIPKFVDDYLCLADSYRKARNCDNPVWHIHAGKVPELDLCGFTFALLVNIASACNADHESALWKFIVRYRSSATPGKNKILDDMVHLAVNYYCKYIKPTKACRVPSSAESEALINLADALSVLQEGASPTEIQNLVFEVGKRYYSENLRDWFKMIYEVLLGQSDGPRLGSFISLYGLTNTVRLITKAASKETSV